jgi:hypothetical protein
MDHNLMEALFSDILNTDGVYGVVLLTSEGRVMFESINRNQTSIPGGYNQWPKLLPALDKIREADIVYAAGRLYVRHTEMGFLVVVMAPVASIAMIKLNCDILLPQLKELKSGKKRKGLFRR